MTKEEMRGLLETLAETRNKVIDAVKECLVKIGHAVEFDWEDGGCAPSYPSGQMDDDLTDAFITKIWLEGSTIKVNLHAYYQAKDAEGIDLTDEYCVDYEDILDHLLDELED